MLFENVGSDLVDEHLHMLRPRGTLGYLGRREELTVQYAGGFVRHPTLPSLDSYDQRLLTQAMRMLSRRHTLRLAHAATLVPTTDLLELPGVPFTRVGSHREDLSVLVQSQISRRLETTAAYRLQWVQFDRNPRTNEALLGGSSHGATIAARQALTARLSLTADYDIARQTLGNGETFLLQNSGGGLDYALREDLHLFGSAGVSHLSGIGNRPPRLGPAMHVGLARTTPTATMAVTYRRSYVPSYGFGGTSDNEELTTRLQVPIGRRVFAYSSVSLRRNQPLDVAELALRSLWFHNSLGYVVNDWMRVEGFAAGSRQHIDRPDGRVHHYAIGLQVTATTTTRIR